MRMKRPLPSEHFDGCVVLDTSLGPLVIDLMTSSSPRTVENFLALIDEGFYDGDIFHLIHHNRFAEFGRLWKSDTDTLCSLNPNIFIKPCSNISDHRSFEKLVDEDLKAFQIGFHSGESWSSNTSIQCGSVFAADVSPGRAGARMRVALSSDTNVERSSLRNFGSQVGMIRDCMDTLQRLNNKRYTKTNPQGEPDFHISIRKAKILVPPSVQITESRYLLDKSVFREMCKTITSRHQKYVATSGTQYDEMSKNHASASCSGKRLSETKMRSQETLLHVFTAQHRPLLGNRQRFRHDRTLFICRLNPFTSEDDINVFFSQFGKISRCVLACDKTTGDSLNYAFVEYVEVQACLTAFKKTQGLVLADRHVQVDFYQGGKSS